MQKPPVGTKTKLIASISTDPGEISTLFENSLYEQLGLDYLHKEFVVKDDLAGAVCGLKAFGMRGSAVSMPYKEAVMPLLDRVDDKAAEIGSVNTIVNDDGVLAGYNTDYLGVVRLLKISGIDPSTEFLMRGSGGMAKAVITALHDCGFKAGTLIARNPQTGHALAEPLGYTYAEKPDGLTAPFLINCTPLGMAGKYPDALSFEHTVIEGSIAVLEAVGEPMQTPLLQRATGNQRTLINGFDIFVGQAVEQFKLYTGITPDPAQIEKAAAFALGMTGA